MHYSHSRQVRTMYSCTCGLHTSKFFTVSVPPKKKPRRAVKEPTKDEDLNERMERLEDTLLKIANQTKPKRNRRKKVPFTPPITPNRAATQTVQSASGIWASTPLTSSTHKATKKRPRKQKRKTKKAGLGGSSYSASEDSEYDSDRDSQDLNLTSSDTSSDSDESVLNPISKRPVIEYGAPLGANVPKRLKKKIWAGKFVEFSELLPDRETIDDDKVDLCLSKSSGKLSTAKPKVRKYLSIDEWSEAWDTYLAVYCEVKKNRKHIIECLTYIHGTRRS